MEPIAPNLQAALICDDVRQEHNGKFILIGLFDAIMTQTLPTRYPRLFIITRWCSGQGIFEQKTRILQPDQQTPVAEGKAIRVQLPSPEATATNIELFLNVDFKDAGIHWIEILLDGDLRLRYPLRVNQIQPPPGEQRAKGQ